MGGLPWVQGMGTGMGWLQWTYVHRMGVVCILSANPELLVDLPVCTYMTAPNCPAFLDQL